MTFPLCLILQVDKQPSLLTVPGLLEGFSTFLHSLWILTHHHSTGQITGAHLLPVSAVTSLYDLAHVTFGFLVLKRMLAIHTSTVFNK